MAAHAGLKRGVLASQTYSVRGVYIDGGGVKCFCLHDVDAVPHFDIPETVIENNA